MLYWTHTHSHTHYWAFLFLPFQNKSIRRRSSVTRWNSCFWASGVEEDHFACDTWSTWFMFKSCSEALSCQTIHSETHSQDVRIIYLVSFYLLCRSNLFFFIRNHNFCEWIGLNFDVRLGKREHAELFSSDRSFYMKIVLYFLHPWRCFMACGLSYKTSSWFWKQTWIWLFFLPPVWSESVVF